MIEKLFFAFALVMLICCSPQKKMVDKDIEPELTQENTTSTVQTIGGIVLVPGFWQPLNFDKSSGQHFLKNAEDVIIAVAKNPMESYPFYEPEQSGYETIEAFTKWDMDFQSKSNPQAEILKKDQTNEYQIWKFTDDKGIDNVFLYGRIDDDILNLLVYTDDWTESETLEFLEKTFRRNKK